MILQILKDKRCFEVQPSILALLNFLLKGVDVILEIRAFEAKEMLIAANL